MTERIMSVRDLEDKKDWLKMLSIYVEQEYELKYQHHIDGVVKLLNEMLKRERMANRNGGQSV